MAIGIDQTFEITDVFEAYGNQKKIMFVDIWRNGFLTTGQVDYARYASLLLNETCYERIKKRHG